MTHGIELLIGGLFEMAFGNPIAVGIVGVILFIIFLVAIRLSFEGAFGLFMAFIHILALFGNLPLMIWYGILLIDGLIIGIAVLRLTGHR